MKPFYYDFLSDDELLRISRRIKEKEKITSGEIVVSIKQRKGFFSKWKPIRVLAENEFRRLGIKKTEAGTGILLFMLLEDRQFYVLADEGIHSKVADNTWDKISAELAKYFSEGKFCEGILAAVEEIGNILSVHFPILPGDKNEISNKVIIRL